MNRPFLTQAKTGTERPGSDQAEVKTDYTSLNGPLSKSKITLKRKYV